MTHRKHTNLKLVECSFDPEQLNTELSLRSAIREHETREPPPAIDLQDHSVPTLSINEVLQVIKNCKATSTGPSNIPHFIFREFWDILTPLYHHLWNRSLESGTFPSCYKKADLLAIPKVRNAKTAEQVRGISVTSIAARLFERAVHKKWIMPQIVSIGDPHQFAYKQGLSTNDCLLCFQHFILSNLDNSEIDGVHATFIDYSKAFDRVNQEQAANQYCRFIKSPHIRKWLYDFSTNRKQRLIWENKPLSYQSIDRGCSQGTVGGPGLFSMFTDDSRALHPTSRQFKYSDDTNCLSLCRKNPSKEESEIFKNEIKNLLSWAKNKNLDINMKKSKNLRFCLNRFPLCQCSSIDEELEAASEAVVLGVLFQEDCSFRGHCRRLLSVLRSTLYLLKDMKLKNASIEDIHLVFESLILSRIRYCLSVYGSDTASMKKIDKFLQKCFEKKFCASRFDIFHLLQVEDQRNLANIRRNPQHPLYDYLTSHGKPRTTRHKFSTVRPYVRTKAFHNAFCNRVLSFST